MNQHKNGDDALVVDPGVKEDPKPHPSQGPIKDEPSPERAQEEKERMSERAERKR